MADNDSYEKDMEEIFGETRGERERKRLKQISDAAAESVRLANDFKQELKKEEIQSDDPIVQKCLDIIRNPKARVQDLDASGYYSVYIVNKRYFSIYKGYFLGVDDYTITINWQDYKFSGARSDLKELYKLCVAKYKEQSQERKKETLGFLNDADKKGSNKRSITLFLFVFAGLTFMATGVINYIASEKRERVKKQVEAYEKTLPAEYMEYKHAVEHYRDSLMHAKRR